MVEWRTKDGEGFTRASSAVQLKLACVGVAQSGVRVTAVPVQGCFGGLWGLLEEAVFPVSWTDVLFNPYNGIDPQLDLPDGDKVRRENLRGYLESITEAPRVLVVGEAPGPWGCRFSGVLFTNERQLVQGLVPFGGRTSGKAGMLHREASADVFWKVMGRYHPWFLAWNCVPFHPHIAGRKLSIRTPTKGEIEAYAGLLKKIAAIVRPEVTVALGRKAEEALGPAELGDKVAGVARRVGEMCEAPGSGSTGVELETGARML